MRPKRKATLNIRIEATMGNPYFYKLLKRYKKSFTREWPSGAYKAGITQSMFERGYKEAMKKILAYKPGHEDRVNLKVSIHAESREVIFSCDIKLSDSYRDAVRFRIKDVALNDIEIIERRYKPFIEKKVNMSDRLIETSNPLVPFNSKVAATLSVSSRLKDLYGNDIQGGILDKLLIQHLAGNAPIINDILRFYEKYKRTNRVREIYSEGTLEAVCIYPKSLTELTGIKSGKKLDAVKKELKSLSERQEIYLSSEEDEKKKKKKRNKRDAGVLHTPLIYTFSQRTTPIEIKLSPILFDIDGGFRKMPANLREKWDRWSPKKRKPYHELAYFWAYQLPATPDKRSLELLKKHWGIQNDKQNPKREMERVRSCFEFLEINDLLLSYKIIGGDEVYFHVDKHELSKAAPSKKIDMEIFQ
jgi:hypothetical protein